jgi:hypothetical protein
MDNGVDLPGGILGIGPLAIGDVKYKTESGLFKRMIASDKPVHFDFRDAPVTLPILTYLRGCLALAQARRRRLSEALGELQPLFRWELLRHFSVSR